MKIRHLLMALVAAVSLSFALAGTASASFTCYGNVTSIPMYGDGPGVGPVDWYMGRNEAFIGQLTVVSNGHFWSFGHSTGSAPYDYWVLTEKLRC
ncbi:hypothetical protein Q5424_15565 [Conexibacter sp. JD483]|uniref:hypothetical protein n=1 Tax=unclassified Conexibacter TaxID=2627773 RepID=UPI0027192751|nr:MULTISPECIES: hypothetical protein [unclassified Conexibacter]MDO8185690.1 hypothetical protein [Conexibacter sp. CPCC 205706]MDO8199067.1 hypothetical protein [Conexibacter sp. CPCC 205762]MDR9370514.1 hypothetical protein [Conexibacter sp. JD483]